MTDDRHADIDKDPEAAEEIAYLRRTLGSLDPPRDLTSASSRRDRHLVAGFIARQAGVGPRRSTRRRVLALAAGVAVAGTIVVGGAVIEGLSRARPAVAATPRALAIIASADGNPASGSLEQLAQVAEHAGPQTGQATVDHLVTDRWDLNTVIDGKTVTSAIIASRGELWRTHDNQARTIEQYLPPQFPTPADRDAWRDDGSPRGEGETRQDYPRGTFPAAFPARPPQQPAALAGWLRRTDTSDTAVISGVTDLLNERALTGRERSAVLRVLARYTTLAYAGTTTDRAGRPGVAFTAKSRSGGGDVIHVFVIDSRTAAILAYEKILTAGGEALHVHRPAVISYSTYRTVEFLPHIPS